MKKQTADILLVVAMISVFILAAWQVVFCTLYFDRFTTPNCALRAAAPDGGETEDGHNLRTVRLKQIRTDEWLADDVELTEEEIEKAKDYYTRVYGYVVQAGVNESMTETQCWECIQQWICEHTEYDYYYQKYHWNDILDDGISVCNGYAELVYIMCRICDIDCYKVDGSAGPDQGSHAWNYVCLDGRWYWADVTWADVDGNGVYLLSETLWEDHVPKRFWHKIPLPDLTENY